MGDQQKQAFSSQQRKLTRGPLYYGLAFLVWMLVGGMAVFMGLLIGGIIRGSGGCAGC